MVESQNLDIVLTKKKKKKPDTKESVFNNFIHSGETW